MSDSAGRVQTSLADELNALVRSWVIRSDDPYFVPGAQAGYFFAASALREALRRHDLLVEPEVSAPARVQSDKGSDLAAGDPR